MANQLLDETFNPVDSDEAFAWVVDELELAAPPQTMVLDSNIPGLIGNAHSGLDHMNPEETLFALGIDDLPFNAEDLTDLTFEDQEALRREGVTINPKL